MPLDEKVAGPDISDIADPKPQPDTAKSNGKYVGFLKRYS
jgi:hypothetical protein